MSATTGWCDDPHDEAHRIVASVSYGRIRDVHVLRTERGVAIVAVHEQQQEGTTHLFVMERSGDEANYHVIRHAELDTDGFRGADWTAEVVGEQTEQWARARAILDRIAALAAWLEADPPARFAALVDAALGAAGARTPAAGGM